VWRLNLGVSDGQESKTIYSQESQESGQAYRRKVEKGRSEDSPSIANIELFRTERFNTRNYRAGSHNPSESRPIAAQFIRNL
jgi:hypothetical protein